jgi:hypothetical protein
VRQVTVTLFNNLLHYLVTKQIAHTEHTMYTTVNEDGILNNYATEPQMYYAEYPSPEQQRRYAQLGGVAILLISSLLLVAFSVSAIV